jgi:glycosyltransferase involved in cell wall biosynthesis
MNKKTNVDTLKKRQILILNYEFPPLGGGASPVSYEIAKGYVKLGHKIDVVTMGFKGLPSKDVKDGIRIFRVPCLRSKKEICHPWEQLSFLRNAKKFLRRHMKKNNYDVCHCHFIIPTGVIALWLKKKFGLEYIITSHGSDVLGYNNKRSFKYIYPLIKKPWKKIVENAKYTITPSKFLQGKILEITKKGNFIVIPNGIDKEKFKPMKKEKKILVVARLFENKGVQDILDTLKSIDLHDWKVDIVGEGPYRDFLEKKARENGIKDKVKFHGWIDNNSIKMKELYGKAKIFISASWFESFGLTVLEAIQASCYPLLSDIEGHKQFDLKESNYFKLGDSQELSIKIKDLIESKMPIIIIDNKFYLKNIVNNYLEVIGR